MCALVVDEEECHCGSCRLIKLATGPLSGHESRGHRHRSKQCPGILTVNRKVYHECIAEIRKITEFSFSSLPCLRNFFDNLNETHQSLITRLSVPMIMNRGKVDYYDFPNVRYGPLSRFVSAVRKSCEHFSKADWSFKLAYNVLLNCDDCSFTLSTVEIRRTTSQKSRA